MNADLVIKHPDKSSVIHVPVTGCDSTFPPDYAPDAPENRQGRLRRIHGELNAAGMNIMRTKNHDYTGGDNDSPYRNFEGATFLDIDPGKGILLRVLDKLRRIDTYLEKGELKVPNEGLADAVVDVRNYMVLLYAMLTEKTDA